jgi:RNA polymerase sigma-70 factor (ECF subfamily)
MVTKSALKSWFSTAAGEAEFAALYRVELPRIYNFFRYRVGDGPVAEDLTSATFEKAWRNRHRYRHDLSAFSTWLYTIARRVAIDHYRQRRPEAPLAEAAPVPDGAPPPEAVAQRREEAQKLSRLLARLPDRERELVALKYGAGLSNRDIARVTDLSEGNVAVILHRTRERLRVEWENER